MSIRVEPLHNDFLLGIVIPLKAKAVSRNWAAVETCLARTLRSIANQTDNAFRAVVVGHDRPHISEIECTDFCQIHYELPPIRSGGDFNLHSDFPRILDKQRKIARGMQLLKPSCITHWFVLDADDLISNRFVALVRKNQEHCGLLFDKGNLYYPLLGRFQTVSYLTRICGSTTVIKSILVDVPNSLHTDEQREGIPWCIVSHSEMEEWLTQYGDPMHIDYPAVCYTLQHGENCSDEFRKGIWRWAKAYAKSRFFGRSWGHEENLEFGLVGRQNELES